MDAFTKEAGIHFEAKRVSEYAEISELLAAAANDKAGLFAYSAFATARSELKSHGLDWVLASMEKDNRALDNFGAVLEAILVRAMAIRVYGQFGPDPISYTGAKLDERRATLAPLDREIIEISL